MDYDAIIIGGGPGGFTAALELAHNGKRTLLIEGSKLGGVCLNSGCVPVKSLYESAKVIEKVKRASDFGIGCEVRGVDFGAIIKRAKGIVSSLLMGLSWRLKRAGVDIAFGWAKVVDKNTISLGDRFYTANFIVIASGNVADGDNSNGHLIGIGEILDKVDRLPQKLGVFGGGVSGLEVASIFAMLGSDVTIFEKKNELLEFLDEDVRSLLLDEITKKGIKVVKGAKIAIEEEADDGLYYEVNGEEYFSDLVIKATGSKPQIGSIGINTAGALVTLSTDECGRICVDENCQTAINNIFAIGDICSRSEGIAPSAMYQGKRVASIICQKDFEDEPRYSHAIFTIPEVAWCGISEKKARMNGGEVRVERSNFKYSARALAMGECVGFAKKTYLDGTLVGVAVVGYGASELIAVNEFGVASAHPSLSEIWKQGY